MGVENKFLATPRRFTGFCKLCLLVTSAKLPNIPWQILTTEIWNSTARWMLKFPEESNIYPLGSETSETHTPSGLALLFNRWTFKIKYQFSALSVSFFFIFQFEEFGVKSKNILPSIIFFFYVSAWNDRYRKVVFLPFVFLLWLLFLLALLISRFPWNFF